MGFKMLLTEEKLRDNVFEVALTTDDRELARLIRNNASIDDILDRLVGAQNIHTALQTTLDGIHYQKELVEELSKYDNKRSALKVALSAILMQSRDERKAAGHLQSPEAPLRLVRLLTQPSVLSLVKRYNECDSILQMRMELLRSIAKETQDPDLVAKVAEYYSTKDKDYFGPDVD
ncbi:MAG: hypothetical protein Q8L27_03595 [archaeon]|nr:hypothetical protein [archaeon]